MAAEGGLELCGGTFFLPGTSKGQKTPSETIQKEVLALKRIGSFLCIGLLLAAMLTGCGQTAPEPASADEGQDIDFHVQYVRTNGYTDGETYPKTVWITSAEEIDAYYAANRDKYDLESAEPVYSHQPIGFADAVKEYDDAFFAGHDLLFVVLEEGSGSIAHRVTGVKALPAGDGKYTLAPEILRLIPEEGTDDMAEWHIIIEIGKDYGKERSAAVTPVITDKNSADAPAALLAPVDTVSVPGPYGQLEAAIPETWTAEAAPMDSGKLMYGLYGLILKPRGAAAGQMELFCSDDFGVCGTGLATEETTLAGNTARIGTYDGHPHWDFITFGDERPQIVAQHTDCSAWTAEMWDEALAILDSMQFDRHITEGGAGQFIPESENDAIAVIMEVTHVTATGCTVHLRQYDQRSTTELLYGQGYSLQRLEGGDWVDVPQIIDHAAFTEEGYPLPAGGEAEMETDWAWLYGTLTPGTYRITKTVVDSRKPDGVMSPAYPLTAQFIIAGA